MIAKFFDALLARAAAGLVVFGAYAVTHYVIGFEDRTIMIFALLVLWGELVSAMKDNEVST